jgi:hypothetical protein
MASQHEFFQTEAELRRTGLMTSPEPEVAKTKLGQYLQEAKNLRNQKKYKDALVIVLVSSEYFWRHHQSTKAAGLLLEAADLFYLEERIESSQRCLQMALDLVAQTPQFSWWEKEMAGTIFLLTACLTIIDETDNLSRQLNALRMTLSKRQQARLSREDGYRVAIALRRAIARNSLIPINDLDTKTTLRSRSEHATLSEYLQGLSERYVIIGDGVNALRLEAHQEDV